MQLKYLHDLEHIPCMRKQGHKIENGCMRCIEYIVFDTDTNNIDIYEYIKNVSFNICLFIIFYIIIYKN